MCWSIEIPGPEASMTPWASEIYLFVMKTKEDEWRQMKTNEGEGEGMRVRGRPDGIKYSGTSDYLRAPD